jgi:opacity protein-like surface antigen
MQESISMIRLKMRTALLIAAVLLVSTSASALDLGGHDRDGTVLGLTFGHGWNSVQFTQDKGSSLDTGSKSTFTGGVRVGWAPSDYFIGSIGFYGWKKSYYPYNYTSTSISQYNFMLEGYFFPMGEGFWIKGGVGRGTLDVYAKAPIQFNDIIFNEKNWAWSTGAGYEFRVADEVGIGLSYDLIYLPVGDFGGLTDVKSISHNLSINIHYYM